jgi:hypothetical protein
MTAHDGWEQARKDAHMYALRCIAHRMRKFGFEPLLNRLDAPSLRILAGIVHEPLASACRREADVKDHIACEYSVTQ